MRQAFVLRDGTQVQMGPGMGGNLVTFTGHAFDDRHKFWSGVDLSLIDVGSCYEECRFGIVRFEYVQNMCGICLEGAIIVL